jgi:hypothetical protein
VTIAIADRYRLGRLLMAPQLAPQSPNLPVSCQLSWPPQLARHHHEPIAVRGRVHCPCTRCLDGGPSRPF